MSWFLQKSSKLLELNSPPLSVRKHKIFFLASFSTNALKLFNKEKVYAFSLKKYTHVLRKILSIKLKKYFLLLLEEG